jgi:upstream activation factor subunit UAF30
MSSPHSSHSDSDSFSDSDTHTLTSDEVLISGLVPNSTSDSQVPNSSEKQRKHRVVNFETVSTDMTSILTLIEAQIRQIRENATGDGVQTGVRTGVRFLASIASKLKRLQKDVSRASKAKPKRVVQTGVLSGFTLPRTVSSEMSTFAGWELGAKKSRIEITKAICSYIKENNLNDPKERKNVIMDEKLRSLLKYTEPASIPYYSLQKLITPLQVA